MEARQLFPTASNWVAAAACVVFATGFPAAPQQVDDVVKCADAIRRAPGNPTVSACAAPLATAPSDGKTDSPVKAAAKAAQGMFALGDMAKAREWCLAALSLKPDEVEAQNCAKAIGERDAADKKSDASARGEQAKLAQARALLDARNPDAAKPLLDALAGSQSLAPATLPELADLQSKYAVAVANRVDAAQRAEIERARLQIADSKRADAATTLKGVIASSASTAVIDEARRMLADTGTSWWTVFVESLRNPWLVQLVAVLFAAGVLFFLLHAARAGWRAYVERARRKSHAAVPWTFAGVTGDDSLHVRDPVLDALRRVPAEIKVPIWRPTRLLLYPVEKGWEVWEDFGVPPDESAPPMREEALFGFIVNPGADDKNVADAFQKLELSVGAGAVTVSGIAGVWTGLIAWWKSGDPAIAVVAQKNDTQVPPANGQTVATTVSEIVIRLTATGPAGTSSVLASTGIEPGVDSVALTSDRAAYKLLSRLSQNKEADSVEQVDAHAAFRQGATLLSLWARTVAGNQIERDRRLAMVTKAIYNLEFARRTFDGDDHHRTYYIEAARLEAIARACAGGDDQLSAATRLFEELMTATAAAAHDRPTTPDGESAAQARLRKRERQLNVESRFNHAMLAAGAGSLIPGKLSAAAVLAGERFVELAREDPTLAPAAGVWRLWQLANLARREWPLLKPDAIDEYLRCIPDLQAALEAAVTNAATGQLRRAGELLRRYYLRSRAIVRLRDVGRTHAGRWPFGPPPEPLDDPTQQLVTGCLDDFTQSAALGACDASSLAIQAYAMLLTADWEGAEAAAVMALDADKTDQFAAYIAAEAAMQRKDVEAVKRYLASANTPATDPALCALLTVVAAAAPAAPGA